MKNKDKPWRSRFGKDEKIALKKQSMLTKIIFHKKNLKWRPSLGSETISGNLKSFKNHAFFHFEPLLILKTFNFLSWLFWSRRKNSFIRKWTFMTSSTEGLLITIHIWANISRSKCNQAIKFGQLMYPVSVHYLKSPRRVPRWKSSSWIYSPVKCLDFLPSRQYRIT